MRSRYSAFVLRDERYLLATWHASQRPSRIPFDDQQIWAGLKVIKMTSITTDSAQVEFVARSRIGLSKAIRHHERSRFIREGGIWFYLDGVVS